jgi:hypothetical protein
MSHGNDGNSGNQSPRTAKQIAASRTFGGGGGHFRPGRKRLQPPQPLTWWAMPEVQTDRTLFTQVHTVELPRMQSYDAPYTSKAME